MAVGVEIAIDILKRYTNCMPYTFQIFLGAVYQLRVVSRETSSQVWHKGRLRWQKFHTHTLHDK